MSSRPGIRVLLCVAERLFWRSGDRGRRLEGVLVIDAVVSGG
jgi:hypothetical protein